MLPHWQEMIGPWKKRRKRTAGPLHSAQSQRHSELRKLPKGGWSFFRYFDFLKKRRTCIVLGLAVRTLQLLFALSRLLWEEPHSEVR